MKGKDRATWVHLPAIGMSGHRQRLPVRSLVVGADGSWNRLTVSTRSHTPAYSGPYLIDTVRGNLPAAHHNLTVGQTHRHLARRTGPLKDIPRT
jgi:hypothetical protein